MKTLYQDYEERTAKFAKVTRKTVTFKKTFSQSLPESVYFSIAPKESELLEYKITTYTEGKDVVKKDVVVNSVDRPYLDSFVHFVEKFSGGKKYYSTLLEPEYNKAMENFLLYIKSVFLTPSKTTEVSYDELERPTVFSILCKTRAGQEAVARMVVERGEKGNITAISMFHFCENKSTKCQVLVFKDLEALENMQDKKPDADFTIFDQGADLKKIITISAEGKIVSNYNNSFLWKHLYAEPEFDMIN